MCNHAELHVLASPGGSCKTAQRKTAFGPDRVQACATWQRSGNRPYVPSTSAAAFRIGGNLRRSAPAQICADSACRRAGRGSDPPEAPWACRGHEAPFSQRCWRTTCPACAASRSPRRRRFWRLQASARCPTLERLCLSLRWRRTPACASWPTCTPARSCQRATCWCEGLGPRLTLASGLLPDLLTRARRANTRSFVRSRGAAGASAAAATWCVARLDMCRGLS